MLSITGKDVLNMFGGGVIQFRGEMCGKSKEEGITII